ncbi:unnamed protein product [Owenia fusiformis]|uniref:Uncharacterized protein n=1 Tax=Owenia fusiformis TaxID=6347 RepID=A0A8J1Y517_OWEFU|nr:unnamed protein product [Owenia fusiformis]
MNDDNISNSSLDDPFSGAAAARQANSYFEKFERFDCQEILTQTATNWILSTDEFKLQTEPPSGLITTMPALSNQDCLLLFPENKDVPPIDIREFHQVIRELTMGIYVLNQLPCISLEANFDQSTSCQLPPAYYDTRVGQILINVDYMMKCLWHGAYFPKEKRTKFSERWRTNLDVNSNGRPETKKSLLTEFTSSGMLDITSDPVFSTIYDKLPKEQPGDTEMAEERRFFMSNVESLSMQLTAFQKSVQQYNNLFVVDSDWIVTSLVKLTEDKLDHQTYERLNAKLQVHEMIIREHLTNKQEVARQLEMLKLISFLVPLLVSMKRKMKIPDLTKIMQPMTGDETKTERELPPLILGPDFKCTNFHISSHHYFHLHGGILIDYDTDNPIPPTQEVQDRHEELYRVAKGGLGEVMDPDCPIKETYPAPIVTCNGKNFYALVVDFETFYSSAPQKPKWVEAWFAEMQRLKPKRLPITDIHTYETFKKYFGYKKATKYKNIPTGLKGAAIRGFASVFHSLSRKCPPARLSKQDEIGLSLIHHAAMYNRVNILALLIMQSMDINVRRNNNVNSTGPTPLHLASRCGALDAVSCLIGNFANVLVTDTDGWAPIHYAAYYDQELVIKMLIRKHETLLELQTKNDLKSTPILLAASSGALASLRCLINLGANVTRQDDAGSSVIQLAALRFHTNILEFFIKWNREEVKVWDSLVGMLRDTSYRKKDSAVKCLEVMSTSDPDHWSSILKADGIPALVDLLRLDSEEIQSVAASVLCNISEHDPVRRALGKANAASILIQLLGSPVDDIQSRAAIVLSDLACVDDNQSAIADQGGIPPLVNLLDSELEDVLVNTVNAIRVMCTNNHANQIAVADNSGIEPLVEFLTVNSDILQAASAAAIAAVAEGNRENQDVIIDEGAAKPLVDLIKGRNVTVQVKAASALLSLAENNPRSQRAFLDLDGPKALNKLLKIWSMEVKEQGACALWALAGDTHPQQKDIAERIGITTLIEILMLKSEKLQYVGCQAIVALGKENLENQTKICDSGGIQPLVRLLRAQKTSETVLMTVVRTLGIMCVGLAHGSNKHTQNKIAEEKAISTFVHLLNEPPSQEIQVEVACTLASVVLNNASNQSRLREETGFTYKKMLHLLTSKNEEIRLKAGMALAVFAFNNTSQQYAIREAGGVEYRCFQHFLESENEYYQCQAAFQIVVLARVIIDMDQVNLSAKGVTVIVNNLSSEKEKVVLLAASLISSLAHTRAGIPDAMITCGAIDALVEKLKSENSQVRAGCAIALGYLSYNKTAARMLMVYCRNTPGMYERLMDNVTKDAKIAPEFIDDFKRQQIIGLPCLSLEKHGGPPAVPPKKDVGKRPYTSVSLHSRKSPHPNYKATSLADRAKSAPALAHRGKSAASTNSGPKMLEVTDLMGFGKKEKGLEVKALDNGKMQVKRRNQVQMEKATAFKSQLSAWSKK